MYNIIKTSWYDEYRITLCSTEDEDLAELILEELNERKRRGYYSYVGYDYLIEEQLLYTIERDKQILNCFGWKKFLTKNDEEIK